MKIFVSSTYDDLIEHRRAVRDAILRLGHQPIGMEDFGSRPETWNKAALNAIDGCGAFVGIYAHRYGSIPIGDSLSITEQEFDKAQTLGISRFCYRVNANHVWLPKFVDSGEAKEKLDAFMKKIDALLRSQFTTPDNLASQVDADLGRFVREQTASIQSPALHSIPTPPADFTGRVEKIAQLVEQLVGGSAVAISGLAGMGGLGKTALAYVAADKLKVQYPDAQILVEMQGTGKTPLQPADAMAHIIHALQPTADLRQASPDDIAAQYCTLLDGRRILILLDNAEDAAQVKPLIPPATCALLVTSRRYFTIPGLHPLRLDLLSESDARDFLLKLTGSKLSMSQASEIARLCGYLPLALRIAGSALAEHVDLRPTEYAKRLVERRDRLMALKSESDPGLDVGAAIETSYAFLASDQQKLWCVLAIFPAPFDARAAAAVWDVDDDRAHALLSHFVRYSLLDFTSAVEEQVSGSAEEKISPMPLLPGIPTGRYSLHDLLSAFADAHTDDAERTSAQLRHAQYYLSVARTADEVYLKGGNAVLEGLALFDAEFPHIRAGQMWAAENAKLNDAAARLCSDYPDASEYCLALRSRRSEWITWLKTAVVAAQELGEKHLVGNHLNNLGRAYADLGEGRHAIEYYTQTLAIARETGDKSMEGNTLGNLGRVHTDLGELRQAVKCQEQALEISRQMGDLRGQAYHLGDLGRAFVALRDQHKAKECFGETLKIAQEIGDRRMEGYTLGNLGVALRYLGEIPQAIINQERALGIAREIGDTRMEGNTLSNLGLAHAASGETSKAIEYQNEALAISREIGDRRLESNALGNLGLAHLDLSKTHEAIDYINQALAIAREIENRRNEGIQLENLGKAFKQIGDMQQAIALTEAALEIYQAIKSPLVEQARKQLMEFKQSKQKRKTKRKRSAKRE